MSEKKKARQLERPVVLYDKSCKFCVTTTEQARSLDKEGKIEWLDVHDDAVRRRFPRIDWERAEKELHLIHRDGRVTTGSRAVRDVADLLGGEAGHVLAQIMDLPGIREAADIAYHIISENRDRISATMQRGKQDESKGTEGKGEEPEGDKE